MYDFFTVAIVKIIPKIPLFICALIHLKQLFEGSWDQHSPSTHLFYEAVLAHYVRIRPESWYGGIGLRVELLGCPGTFVKFLC